MIVFVDVYSEETDFLQKTLQSMNVECEFVVLQDSFFLPDGMLPVSEYIIREREKKQYRRKDLHYAFLDIPEYWQIQPQGYKGAVYNLGKHMGTVYFKEPLEERLVERVEWIAEAGYVQKIDYYNRYGFVTCRVLNDSSGQAVQKMYYTSEGEEVLCYDLKNHTIILFEKGCVKQVFESKEEFECMVYSKQITDGTYMLLTSKRQAELLSIVEKEVLGTGEDKANALVLLGDVAGIEVYRSRFPMYVLSNTNTAGSRNEAVTQKSRVCYFEVPDKNPDSKGDILILTASDRIEGLEVLVEELPDKVFHIAANTAVSDKLLSLKGYPNVRVYQQIKMDILQKLLETCSFYLDINIGREIHSAVIQASMYNLLIVGFENTLHNRDYVLSECVLKQGDYVGLVEKLKLLIQDVQMYQVLIERQNKLAGKSLDILKAHFN